MGFLGKRHWLSIGRRGQAAPAPDTDPEILELEAGDAASLIDDRTDGGEKRVLSPAEEAALAVYLRRLHDEELARQIRQAEASRSVMERLWDTIRYHRWFSVAVVLPVLLASIYYGLIASDIYVSESRFVVQSPGQKQVQISSLSSLLQGGGIAGGQEKSDEVIDYIRSRDALVALQRRVNVRGMFQTQDADFLSRFPRPLVDPTFENLFKYYQKMVGARVDTETGSTILEVRAFSPADAVEINVRLLELGEQLVNRLNDRAQQQIISENEKRAAEAEARVRAARLAMGEFRNRQELLDPGKQAAGVLELTNRLISEQVALQAQLDLTLRVAPENPIIPSLRSRLAALNKQIGAQTGRAVGTDTGLASQMAAYEKLATEQEFASNMLLAANAALEQSRTDARKQHFYLERIVQPNVPDMPLLPHRLWSILTIAAAALFLYFIAWMLVVGILEHAPDED